MHYIVIIIFINYVIIISISLFNCIIFVDILPNFMKYLKQYGSVYSVRIGPYYPFILFCDPKSAEFLLSNPKILDKSLGYTFLHNWLGTGLLTAPGSF